MIASTQMIVLRLLSVCAFSLLGTSLVSAQETGGATDTGSTTETGTEGATDSLMEAIIIQGALNIVRQNIEASDRESGEIDQLIRAISGISPADIEKYGICGGPNSEVRRLFGDLCNDI